MFLKIGHRGAKAYETENTLESFSKAIDLGVNAIELDVRQSKDAQLVIIHDDNLKKVFGINMHVNMTTLKELKKVTGNRVPTLDEALFFIDRKVDKILVELKETGYEKMVIDIIRKEKLQDRTIIVSFHQETLSNIQELSSGIETGLIYTKLKKPVDTAQRLNAQYLVPMYRFIHTKDVEKAHKNNLRIIAWTINTEEEARKYISKGVDGIASDKPEIFNRVSHNL